MRKLIAGVLVVAAAAVSAAATLRPATSLLGAAPTPVTASASAPEANANDPSPNRSVDADPRPVPSGLPDTTGAATDVPSDHDHDPAEEESERYGFVADEERDCLEPVPEAAGIAGVTDDGAKITLAVHLLLDGIDATTGRTIFQTAAAAYEPLGLVLAASTVEPVTFRSIRGSALIKEAKSHLGGRRPANADLVYVLTGKDITNDGDGKGLVGLADCIGGVRYASSAFAVGEANFPAIPFGPFRAYNEIPAKTLGHELGHLMGAHHHYANCAEGAGIGAKALTELSPCSLMFNYVDFQALRFSVLEGSVMRGHASEYARP